MDYIVLDKQMHINDAYDAFYAQAMIGLNDRTQIEDLASMLQLLENKEEYERVDADLERMAEAKMQVQTAEAAY